MDKRLALAAFGLLALTPAQADEGMWLPEQLPAMSEQLVQMGLELPAEQLADPLSAPLGAIISLGGCSASFISAEGLIATNHHCVSGYLQYNSNGEQNRARDGYLAPDRAGELSAGPSARVQVVESIVDVTDRVNAKLRRRTKDAKRVELVEGAIKEIVAECEAQAGRRCQVASFYGGQQYRLITALELKDLRVVYAPPRSVGDYGGEIDNWEWPRHAGDFALLRAYVAPDGGAAPFAEENVPFQPAHHLQIATDDLDPGDFVMVAGYPGATYRYASAAEMRFNQDVEYPFWIDLLGRELLILEEEAAKSEAAAARLQDPMSGTSNYLKYSQGMLENFTDSGVVERKAQEDAALRAWIDELPERQALHGAALSELDALIAKEQAAFKRDTLLQALRWAGDLFSAAHAAYRLSVEREKPDLQREFGYQERDLERHRQRSERVERSLWLPADRRLVGLILTDLLALPEGVPELNAWVAAQGGLDAALERLYDDPSLAETEDRLALLDMSRAELEASEDPWVQLAVAVEAHLAAQRLAEKADEGARLRVEPVVMEALIAAKGGLVYPDANSTLRVTVGHVEGYSPRDGVAYLPQTTLPGVVAKADAFPFDAPERLLAAAASTEPEGRWVDPELGQVPVDFLTTLDTTGGNSGSATLNAKGELVGLIFDGNYEAMSADWLFDPELTRSIHVDVRYMLWILDEVEGAVHVLDELGISPD